jgi:DNA-binding HxlR family transcriptional regulator
MPPNKSYEQYCGVAKALDVVGERWTLLVVRELLAGPMRYTDLIDGIPGIATDMLAARLKTLEESELVTRRQLPPPAASTVYELTEAGRGLEPVVHELARFGASLLGRRKGEAFRIHWLAMPLRMMFRPDRATGAPLIVQFESDKDTMHARFANGTIETNLGPAQAPDVVIAGDMWTISRAGKDRAFGDEAVAKGRLKVTGVKADVKRALQMLGLRD